MGFWLTPRSMILDDLELLQCQILLEFHAISYIWKATMVKCTVGDRIVAH